jgi:hypothetical protein
VQNACWHGESTFRINHSEILRMFAKFITKIYKEWMGDSSPDSGYDIGKGVGGSLWNPFMIGPLN